MKSEGWVFDAQYSCFYLVYLYIVSEYEQQLTLWSFLRNKWNIWKAFSVVTDEVKFYLWSSPLLLPSLSDVSGSAGVQGVIAVPCSAFTSQTDGRSDGLPVHPVSHRIIEYIRIGLSKVLNASFQSCLVG